MGRWLQVVIITGFATLGIFVPIPLDNKCRRNQDIVVKRLMTYLNNGHHGDFLFKLRDLKSSQSGDPIKGIKATAQETLCLNSKSHLPRDCPFKQDGVVKICMILMDNGCGSVKSAKCDTYKIGGINKGGFGGTASIPVAPAELSCLPCIFDHL